MKKIWSIVVLSLIIVAGVINYSFNHSIEKLSNEVDQEGIEWISFEEAMKRHANEPRYWIIDVYTDWCGWCKRMDASTFHDPVITKEIRANYYAVKLDAEQKGDIVVKDRTYKFVGPPEGGRRGYHELAAELLQGKMSYPTIVYLDKDANMIQPVPGYQTREQIHPILTFFSSDVYKSTTWADYQNNYVSPFEKDGE